MSLLPPVTSAVVPGTNHWLLDEAPDAVTTLIAGDRAATSWLGIGLSLASVIVMPLLGVAKKRLGARLDSGATSGEGTQNLLCAYLAAAVLGAMEVE